ncbi:cytidine deaminase [Pseudofulvibacter geojedonensis]|uniref:Cytidine deaminase n=1 Tax=Pseudofulvibacter geojedonensis TaxID=1123758 RepID=A0ABW3I4D3_9FLAO
MKEYKISTTFIVYEQLSDLPSAVFSLMEAAINARNNAYSPYSKFNVGAAVLLDNEKVVVGSNQENAAYPSGLCAERVAIFQAGAIYPTAKIKKIAITATSQNHKVSEPIPPCGSCRQSIAEYETRQKENIEIYFMGEEGSIMKSNSLSDLLPLTFQKSHL